MDITVTHADDACIEYESIIVKDLLRNKGELIKLVKRLKLRLKYDEMPTDRFQFN